MEADTKSIELLSTDKKVIYTERAISGSTMLGGPLAAAYLIACNFRELGKDDQARNTWIIGVLLTLIIIPTFVLMPDSFLPEPIARSLHFVWAIVAYLVVKRFQQNDIEAYLLAGGQKGSWWKAAGIGLIAMLVVVAYVFIIFLITEPPVKTFSGIPKFNRAAVQMDYSGCKIYYDSSAISESDARIAGSILETVGYFSPHNSKLDALFYKKNGQHTIVFLVDHSLYLKNRKEVDPIFTKALRELQDAYTNRNYQFQILAFDALEIKDEIFLQPK
jgi:hypothetical protein